jgi:hypothetical protein
MTTDKFLYSSLFDGDITFFTMNESGPGGTQRSLSPTLAEPRRLNSLDSDDRHTRDALKIPPADDSDSDLSDSEVFAALLQQKQASSRSRSDTPQFQGPVSKTDHPSQLGDRRRAVPFNPVNREDIGRAGSKPSRDSAFPSPGTRARELRDRLEREEKHTSYKPPRGTRAALH